jgi:hypothetical protein
MQKGGHLTPEGLKEIISLKASINKGLPPKILAAFSDIKSYELPNLDPITVIPDPNWLVGFITGRGVSLLLLTTRKISHLKLSLTILSMPVI